MRQPTGAAPRIEPRAQQASMAQWVSWGGVIMEQV